MKRLLFKVIQFQAISLLRTSLSVLLAVDLWLDQFHLMLPHKCMYAGILFSFATTQTVMTMCTDSMQV